jgi:hypothetical protein
LKEGNMNDELNPEPQAEEATTTTGATGNEADTGSAETAEPAAIVDDDLPEPEQTTVIP